MTMIDDNEISQSGPIALGNHVFSREFTDVETIYTGCFNIIAHATRYGRRWTLKALKAEMRGDEAYELLLRKEFYMLISMQHPNVVTAVGLEEVEGLGTCIVMEWIDGQTLKSWLAEAHTQREKLHIARQICSALEYVHAKQVVLRDLKPSNVMITRNGGNVKLIDFGLSDTDSHLIFKQSAGSPRYMAPEQQESRETNLRCDIYSLGCILEQMKLSKAYAPLVRRCKCSEEKRFANVAEVRSAFNRTQTFRRRGVKLLVGILFLGGLALPMSRTVTDQATIATLENQLDSTNRALLQLQSERKLADVLTEEGKQKMDSIAQYDLNALNTYEACVQTYTRLALELTRFHTDYCKAAQPRVSYEDYIVIRQTLSDYFGIVLKPLEDKVASRSGK